MKFLIKKALVFYKKHISPSIGAKCIYNPTCSMYMYEAVEEYGVILGILKGLKRLFRCVPWKKGGFDPVKFNLRGKIRWVL